MSSGLDWIGLDWIFLWESQLLPGAGGTSLGARFAGQKDLEGAFWSQGLLREAAG